MDLLSLTLSAGRAAVRLPAKATSSVFTQVSSPEWLLDSQGGRRACVWEESGPVTHLLGKGLLQSGQGGVGVGGVRLQGLDSLLQAAHLLLLVSKLLLEVFDLSCE